MAEVIEITGTRRRTWPGSTRAAEVDADTEVLLTAWLRPRPAQSLNAAQACELGRTLPRQRTCAERAQLLASTDASDDDRDALRAYCDRFGIDVLAHKWRSAVLRAPLGRSIAAFGAAVATFVDAAGSRFRHRDGSLHAPPDIAGVLHGVFGFHQWPRSHRLGPLQRHATPLTAPQICERYRFPDAGGRGQVIAILQLRGEFRADDFTRCMQAQAIAPPQVLVKRIDNAALEHKTQTVKDLEAALDAQIAAALAPQAQIVLYQAPDDERGVLDALRDAVFDGEIRPSIVSVSYGWPEPLWTPAALAILNDLFLAAALLGISVFCSSGDNGAELGLDGKPHVVAPASIPFAHACGATEIQTAGGSDREPAWERTGGGFSEFFPAPQWQHGMRGRGVPDVAAQESPGYLVYLEGTELAAGGTSAVAPMWAALAARLNERLAVPVGFFAPLLYGALPQPGWNPRTGLGTPDGAALETLLRG